MKTFIKANWLYIFFGLLFLVLNILRIKYVAITCDEAYSYLFYVSKSYTSIATNEIAKANNHILNSILSKFFISIFENNVVCLRLANLIAQGVYLYFSYKLAKLLLSRKTQAFLFFLLLQLNVYLFQFWGLSRGYGLSVALMLGSIVFLLQFFQNRKNVHFICALIFAIAAAYSNLSLLNYFVALCSVSFLVAIVRREKLVFISISIILSATVLYLLLADIIRTLIEQQELYYGGDDGFVTNTIQSLVRQSLYLESDSTILLTVSYVVVVFIVAVFVTTLLIAIRKKIITKELVLILLLVVPICSVLVQHYLFGTKFLIERTALLFVPLLMLPIVIVARTLNNKTSTIALGILVVLFATIFFIRYNTTSTKDWYLDKAIPTTLERIANNDHNKPIKIYMGWRLTSATYYTIQTKYKDQFDELEWFTDRFYKPEEYDYYFLSDLESEDIPEQYELDTTFLGHQVLLYKSR